MRSPVTDLIQRFNALNEVEQKVFLDQVDPQPEPEVAAKKTRKKRTYVTARAASISAAIAKTPKAGTGSTTLDADAPKCGICGNVPDHSDHDPTYLSSHVFEAPKSASSATRRSSRKGAVTSSTPNSETSSEGSLAVGAGGD